MATERQAPDAILELTNLSGTVWEIQDDPDDPDGDWLDADSNNADSVVRVSFPTPTGPPTVGANLQEIRALVRKYGGTGTPKARVELYEDGGLVRAGSDIEITADTVLSFKWNANEISTSDGSLAECRVYGTKAGGSPSVRATIEVGAIEWNVTYDSGQVKTASATLNGTGALAATAHKTATGKATSSGTGSLAAQGGVTMLGAATLAGVGTVTAQGQVTRYGAATLSGTGGLAAAAHVTRTGQAISSGEGTLSTVGVLIIVGTATLSGTGSLSAAGTTGISATILAAQKSLHRLPHVEANVYDYERGIKRLIWTRLYEGSEPDNHHGIAFDGQGSMHRIRAAAGAKLYYQKVTNPGPSSDYSQWTELATNCAGPCVVAAQGARVYIFYKTTSNALWKRYSNDYGQTWNDAQLVSYADVLSLAAAWWGTGDIVVCFALKASELNGIILDTSDQTTTPHTWDDGTHPWLNTYGIGATYNASLDQCELVIAAEESDSPYNHYDLFRTTFSNTYNFLALESFLMAPDGEDITYEYPDCHLPSSPVEYETNRVLVVEKFTGMTAYTRPLTCHMVKGTTWSDTTFTEPRPFLDIAPSYGLRLQSTSEYWWISMPAGVWRAPRPAAAALDLTKHIVSLTRRISSPSSGKGQGESALIIVLDNSRGYFASPGEGDLASLRFRAEIALKLGYKTTQGNEALAAGTYWLDSWEYSSGPNRSVFTITALDGRGLMDRWTARYQMRWNKDDVNPRSVWQIMYQVLARVGIRLTNTPPRPRSPAIDNFYPDFTIDPGTQGTQALNRLLSFVPDGLVFRAQEAFTKNPLPDEQSSYSYGTDHAILAGKFASFVTPTRTRALGRETNGDRVLEEALDWNAVALAIDILDQSYDPNLQTATRAQERADALLRKHALRAKGGRIVVPTNVAQELLDVITVTDVRCGIDQEKYRVLAIHTDYDCRKGQYDQTFTLGAA